MGAIKEYHFEDILSESSRFEEQIELAEMENHYNVCKTLAYDINTNPDDECLGKIIRQKYTFKTEKD